MMGVGNWSSGAGGGSVPLAAAERPAPRVVARPAANLQRAKPDAEDAAASAQRYIGIGDTSFAKQKYSDANDRYRRAVRTAPQLADGWFRQGFALAGMGHHEMAATSLRRGLELKPDWPKSDFRLAALFGGDEAAKTAYLEGLAAAAEARPNNVDLLFLLGVCQHFDGQAQRAATFLKRANELAPGEKAHLQAFWTDACGDVGVAVALPPRGDSATVAPTQSADAVGNCVRTRTPRPPRRRPALRRRCGGSPSRRRRRGSSSRN